MHDAQYKQLYYELKSENDKLRTENGDLLCAQQAHVDQLHSENDRLKARLDRAQQELQRARQPQDGASAARDRSSADVQHQEAAAAASGADLEGVADDQNLFELRIEGAELNVGADVGTFVTVDFYDHLTQVPVVLQCRPANVKCKARRLLK